MHPLHLPILIVLLLIPNTTWRDWRNANSPALHRIEESGAVALMNARTAETDIISPEAGIRTLIAGARMNASGDTSRLGYPALNGNLTASLANAGVDVLPLDSSSAKLITAGRAPGGAARGRFVVETLSAKWPEADAEIAHWRSQVGDRGGVLVIASPNPSRSENDTLDQLTPVVIWQPGGSAGLIYSPSTRRPGLVTNTDIAPTLAGLASVPLFGPTYGAPCSVRSWSFEQASSFLDKTSEQSQRQAREQLAVPFIAIGLAALITLLTLLRLRFHRIDVVWIQAVALIPLVLTIVPRVSIAMIIITALLTTGLLSRMLKLRWPAQNLTVITSALALTVILADALLNHSRMTAASLMGYSPLEGARYYGLGNEVMGISIGSCVILAGVMTTRPGGRWFGAMLWIVMGAILGAPTIGAKAGGLLVAAIAGAVYMIVNQRLNGVRKTYLAAGAAAALCMGVAAIGAMGHFFGDSHVTRTIGQARQFGPSVVASVIIRKSAMDVHLMTHSVWACILLACVAGAWLIRSGQSPQERSAPEFRSIFITGLAATGACLILNDAGVVAAALCAVYPWSYLMATASRSQADARNGEAVTASLSSTQHSVAAA